MLTRAYSLVLLGLTPITIEVEVASHRGVPGLILIGLPAKAVDEAKERLTASLHYLGIRIRGRRTIVNLAPTDLRKTSPALDLAIVVGLLAMYGELPSPDNKTLFIGELALDGTLKPLTNPLALLIGAQKNGFNRVFFPASNQDQVIPLAGVELYPVTSLAEYLSCARGDKRPHQILPSALLPATSLPSNRSPELLIHQIQGQAAAKRALMISAAGHHHLLMTGPPGVGKTLLAQALPQLLPPLTHEESLEVTAIQSLVTATQKLITTRPFRSPHHSITVTGLLGGTANFRPGELSLAHHGVLCLDEMPEFKSSALEALRQPLEQQSITLTNGFGSATFPASVLVVATANPCPCGFRGSTKRTCTCPLGSRLHYQQKLSGPLIDRIDLHLSVAESDTALTKKIPQSPIEILAQISQAQHLQKIRYKPLGLSQVNQVPTHQLNSFIKIEKNAEDILLKASETLNLSIRAHFKMMKIAQTIADLEAAPIILTHHLHEALQYRQALFRDQQF